jgi:Uma2 family endonuclease
MVISAQTYEQVALEDPDGFWELDCGRLRQKPGMTYEHDDSMSALGGQLFSQLEANEFRIFINGPRLRISSGTFYIPDVAVVPRALMRRARQERPRRLAVFEEPVPLVVEVWSPSTGDYAVATKLQEYKRRGDAEVWRLHPYERTLIAWRLQPDGSYTETLYAGGTVTPVALPGVTIDIATLFE